MQMRQLAIAMLAATFTFGAVSAPAMAQSSSDSAHAATKKQPLKKRMVHQSQTGGQIACTKLGCGRIPANCYPTQGYYGNGMPTGNDVIVCR